MTTPNSLPKSTMYVDLDSLLDTRMGTLVKMDHERFVHLLANGYHDRLKDEFDGVDMVEFRSLYKERDVVTLSKSQFTGVITMIQDFVEKTLQQTLRTPFHKEPKIEVNIHPYKLSAETQHMIVRALAHHTNQQADIELVDYPYEMLNPVFVRERYSMMFMYDAAAWLEMNANAGHWKKYTCPAVVVCTPLMIKNEKTAVYEKDRATIIENMNKLSEAVEPMVQLLFVPVSLFSWVANPEDAAKYKAGNTPDTGGGPNG